MYKQILFFQNNFFFLEEKQKWISNFKNTKLC